MIIKGNGFNIGKEEGKGEERRSKPSVGLMLEYTPFLTLSQNFLKRITLRFPKSVNKVRICLIIKY